jgi:hypothetical protein
MHLCALAIVSTAAGAVVPSITVTNPTLTNLPGWVGVVLRLTSDQGPISAIDFGGTDPAKPNEAAKGLFGTFHQRWGQCGEDPNCTGLVPTPKNNVSAPLITNPLNRDSYWSLQIVETAVIYPSEENNSMMGSPLSSIPSPGGFVFGLGDAMHYTTGIALASQSSEIALAYLVIPIDNSLEIVHIRGEVAAGGQKVLIDYRIPEPAGAGLLALAALVLLRRRDRCALPTVLVQPNLATHRRAFASDRCEEAP